MNNQATPFLIASNGVHLSEMPALNIERFTFALNWLQQNAAQIRNHFNLSHWRKGSVASDNDFTPRFY